MKTVLCYGDSLTWGYDAEGPGRHELDDRWPSVLQTKLGDAAHVVAEGLNGRTTAFDDFTAPAERNGARILPTILHSHAPLDLVIIMLGTNDLKPRVAGKALDAMLGMERLAEIVQHHPWPMPMATPKILLVAPPVICPTDNVLFDAIYDGSIEQSKLLASRYESLARELGCGFFDAGSVAKTTPLDGVHLDAANTRAIGEALAPVVRDMLGL